MTNGIRKTSVRSSLCRLRRAAALICVFVLATPLPAKTSEEDINKLIDGLAKEGMSELLLHLVETEPFDDPMTARQIKVAQLRVQYERLAGEAEKVRTRDPALAEQLDAQSRQAFDRLLEAMRQLIHDFHEHEQRPIWQTDLAELMLIEFLQVIQRNAAAFWEFGVPTPEQRQAYESAVVEAMTAASEADLRFFHLQGILPREKDHTERRVNTGLWTRMIDEYYQKRTPYYLAHAAYFTALLPDHHAYFANLGSHDPTKIPKQRDTPEQERVRLLQLAQQKLNKFAADKADSDGVRQASSCLIGRAKLVLKQFDAAVKEFDAVIGAKVPDEHDLMAHLGKAEAFRAQGYHGRPLNILDSLNDHPLVEADLLYRLLVADHKHLLLISQAQGVPADQRAAAIEAAYASYGELLDVSPAMRHYIYRRWESNLLPEGTDPLKLPVVVRMGMGEIARIEGQNLAIQSDQTNDQTLWEQAQSKLQRAIMINQTLRSAQLPPEVRATGLFNLAVARYWTAREDPTNLLEVAQILTNIAADMPSQHVAEEAIESGVGLLRAMRQSAPGAPNIDETYQRACEVLFEQYPTSAAADNERLSYGAAVLVPAGRYLDAVAMYRLVPDSHENYFEAQIELLFALVKVFEQAKGQAREQTRSQLLEEIARVRTKGEQVMHTSSASEPSASARRAVAAARVASADIAMADHEFAKVLRALGGFEGDFPNDPDMISLAFGRRIVALGEAGRPDELNKIAQDMMNRFPDEAAPVIDRVLIDIDRRIELLRSAAAAERVATRKEPLLERQQQLASMAERLAHLLVEWAHTQDFDERQRLPFELIRAKVLRLAGHADQAAERLKPLIESHPDDLEVIHQYAESLTATEQTESLVLAARHYDRLIMGLAQPPYPDIWWNAWMRRLQINDRLGQSTEDIPLRVRQLKMTDQKLGGPRYRQELERLAQKHAR